MYKDSPSDDLASLDIGMKYLDRRGGRLEQSDRIAGWWNKKNVIKKPI